MLLNNRLFQRAYNNALAILVCMLVLIPVYVVIVNSLKDSAQARTMNAELPAVLHFENFQTVVERGKLAQTFVNSMVYATSATIIPPETLRTGIEMPKNCSRYIPPK